MDTYCRGKWELVKGKGAHLQRNIAGGTVPPPPPPPPGSTASGINDLFIRWFPSCFFLTRN